MVHIISDNNYQGKLFLIDSFKDLLPLGNKSLKVLCHEHKNLLVFPPTLMDTDDKLGEDPIFSFIFSDDMERTQVFTSNVMGYIGRGNHQLKIYSRFDNPEKDYFLHYMLQKVFSINLFDFDNSTKEESVFELLMFFFPYYLKRAMAQGVYREYTRFEHNDSNVKGTIDISQHLQRNIPFSGKIAYNTREYSRDNTMTQLIRHTIEYIKMSDYGESILNEDKDTIAFVEEIIRCTPSYSKADRLKVVQKNLKMASHPYYDRYIELQNLCLRILRFDEVMFGESNDDFYGILFDGAWLWEEYCATLLAPFHFNHAENKNGTKFITLFTDRTGKRYPDFYRTDFVIDAKYKRYGTKNKISEAGREDLHQIVTYMYMLKAKQGAFLSPFQNEIVEFASSTLNGYGGSISLLGLEIPNENRSYKEFVEKMKIKESDFCKTLKQYLAQ